MVCLLYSLILEGCASQFPEVLNRSHIDPVLDLKKTAEFIQSQLRNCEEHSSWCLPPEPSSLPRRVLDVGSKEQDKIYLLETHGEKGLYITLSHCWGSKPILKTTKENYDHRRIGIPWSKMPATFKDAIKITRALHIQYLWIDSLCIIQGDILDWEQQSASMADIYSSCYLNLAATAASNSNGGLFSKRWIPSIHPNPSERKRHSPKSQAVSIVQDRSTGDIGKVFVRYSLANAHMDVLILEAGGRNYNVIESAPLLTRAWAYQERLLSPRTVNFHSAELTWDCGFAFNCECGQLSTQEPAAELDGETVFPKYKLFTPDIESRNLVTPWLDVVTNFSKLKLTFSMDKLPALAGIASRFADQIQSDYLAGIWQADVGRGLLWRVDFEPSEDLDTRFTSARANPYRAPTWSWASIDLVNNRTCSVWVSYAFLGPSFEMGLLDSRFEVLDWKCDISGSNPFGRVTDGHLLVKGAALSTTLWYDGNRDTDSDIDNGSEYDWHLGIESILDLFYYDIDVRGDGNSYVLEGETIIALLISFGPRACAILLAPSKRRSGKYERIGVASIDKKHFEYAEEMVLDII